LSATLLAAARQANNTAELRKVLANIGLTPL